MAECRWVEEEAHRLDQTASVDPDLGAAAEEDPVEFQKQDAGAGDLLALADKEWIVGS